MTDAIDHAREAVGDDEQFDRFLDGIEATVQSMADDYGVEVDDDATEAAQSSICGIIADPVDAELRAQPDLDALVEELSDPTSEQARQNAMVGVVGASSDNEQLWRLHVNHVGGQYAELDR